MYQFREEYSLNDFIEAKVMVKSRAFDLHMNGTSKPQTSAIVPYAVLVNHKTSPPTRWTYSDKDSGFILEHKGNLKKGDQILMTYGRTLTNQMLLI